MSFFVRTIYVEVFRNERNGTYNSHMAQEEITCINNMYMHNCIYAYTCLIYTYIYIHTHERVLKEYIKMLKTDQPV